MELRVGDLENGDVVGIPAGALAGLDKEQIWYKVLGPGSYEPSVNHRPTIRYPYDEIYVIPVEYPDGSVDGRAFPDHALTVPVLRREDDERATETGANVESDRRHA